MTEQEYNAADGIRRSALWRMHESPEKYKWFLEHPEPSTPALVFGSAAHKMLLEPESFSTEFVIAPDCDRRTKAGKERYERFVAELGDRTIISQDDFDTIRDITDKARSVPYVQKLLAGEHEVPFFWTDEDTGERCKVRLDILADMDGTLTVADYKTANSAETNVFVNKMYQLGYHLQAFMYTEAVMKCLNLTERPDFVFIAQEKKPPFALNYILVTEDVMLAGMDAFREYIGLVHECKATGYWPGYNGIFNEPNETFLPGWMSLGDEED